MVPCTVPVPLSSRPVSRKATYYTVFLQRTNDRDPVDTSTELLFGQSVHSFTAASDSPQTRFVTAFDYASGQLLRRLQLGSFLFLYHDKEFKKACKTVHSFVDSIIAKAINDREEEKGDNKKRGEEKNKGRKPHHNFLQGLLNSTSDPKRLRSELLNIIQAGRDTTAGLLGHVFYTLARRKDVWAKLEAEVCQLNGKAPTYEELKNMAYVRCILNESK